MSELTTEEKIIQILQNKETETTEQKLKEVLPLHMLDRDSIKSFVPLALTAIAYQVVARCCHAPCNCDRKRLNPDNIKIFLNLVDSLGAEFTPMFFSLVQSQHQEALKLKTSYEEQDAEFISKRVEIMEVETLQSEFRLLEQAVGIMADNKFSVDENMVKKMDGLKEELAKKKSVEEIAGNYGRDFYLNDKNRPLRNLDFNDLKGGQQCSDHAGAWLVSTKAVIEALEQIQARKNSPTPEIAETGVTPQKALGGTEPARVSTGR